MQNISVKNGIQIGKIFLYTYSDKTILQAIKLMLREKYYRIVG